MKHVGFGVPGMHSERLDAERVAQMRSEVPAEEQEHSRIPSFGVGTGHSSTKSRGSRETHSQKERLDLQHAGYGDNEVPAREPSPSTRNEILEQHGVGVATFDEPDANREYERGQRRGEGESVGRCPFGYGSQRGGEDPSREAGSDRHEVCAKDSDLGAVRKAAVPLDKDDRMPMVSPPTSQLNTPAPYITAAEMKSSQFNSNDPTELHIRHP